MSQPVIVLGDATSHGGTVAEGAPTATSQNKPIARVGDKVTCPKCGSTTIAEGDSSMLVAGNPVARHGDKTACGAKLIAKQMQTVLGEAAPSSSRVTSQQTKNAPTAASAATSLQESNRNELSCTLETENNTQGDQLPVIPTESRAKNGKLLFRLKFTATLTQKATGKPASNSTLEIESDNGKDKIKTNGTSDANGKLTLTLETREQGTRKLACKNNRLSMEPLSVMIDEAWFESTFLMTGYNVCSEDDFGGDLVDAKGLNEKHKDDFLYSARGIPMQGTGKTSNGTYITLSEFRTHWHHSDTGAPDWVADESKVSFTTTDGPKGSTGRIVKKNHSIAVDSTVIPYGSKVNINEIGDRYADDTGSQIQDYHIDNFLGAGDDVVREWEKSGFNQTQQRVKFIAY